MNKYIFVGDIYRPNIYKTKYFYFPFYKLILDYIIYIVYITMVMQIISVKKLCIMWINLVFTIFFTLYFINMILITYVPTLTLSILPFPYTPSPPPYLFPDLSSFVTMFKMYNVHCFYLQFSFVYSGPTN